MEDFHHSKRQMSTSGLSLFGFLDRAQAITHLRNACVPTPGATDDDLGCLWDKAVNDVQGSPANCGNPQIEDIDVDDPYISMIANHSQIALPVQQYLTMGASFKFVEVDPLLAFQVIVDTDRTHDHCSKMQCPPTRDDLFQACLPPVVSKDAYHYSIQDHSAVIRSRSHNLSINAKATLFPDGLAVPFGWSLPLVHVVRFEGLCFLHNGYHRAFGARSAGATHVPCLFRDVTQPGEVGNGPGHFDMRIMRSENPPTMAHFTERRAATVRLRLSSRIIHVSWSEHVIYEE